MKNLLNVSKKFICLFLLISAFKTKAQLVYLGDDAVQKAKIDGYQNNKQTAGLVALNGKYYFTTPNGNVYETDGTENNTKTIKQIAPQNLPYLAATNKYLFFAYEWDNSYELMKYSSTEGLRTVTKPNEYNRAVKLNATPVPGNTYLVSEIFTNYDKNTLLVRHFEKDEFMIYAIEDTYAKDEADYVVGYDLDMKNVSTPIAVNTEIETFNGEVYFNGRVKPTGVYETNVTINKKTDADKRKYDFKTNFAILKNKAYPYFRFLRTPKNIYSLVKVEDSTGKYYHNLFLYYDKSIKASNAPNINVKATDFDTQIMDGNIYVSCKGYLWLFDEKKETFINIINEINATAPWEEVQKNKRFLKVGNYYLYRRSGKLFMFDAKLGITKEITTEALAKNYNYFTQHNIYAYSGKNSFYFTQQVGENKVFTKYNPLNNAYTPIEFPNFKKQNFEEIKAINYSNDKFVFLISYLGKKNKPVYKMFFYTEEGEPLITTNTIVKNNEQAPFVPKPFDDKLFLNQLTKIVQEPLNKFKNIKGEPIPYANDEYKSNINLEGFKESRVIDYTSVSKKIRYKAETEMMTINSGLALIDKLEKEIKKLPFPFTRSVPYDVATRKLITYSFNGKMADIDIDLGINANTISEQTLCNITFRADKISNF